jgi:hypothetical protein
MRLIDCKTYEMTEFIDNIPPYAILSHTWEDEEVLYSDMRNIEEAAKKKGFAKIKAVCGLAIDARYQYCWVDTCCIDKSSSAELSEAINSMFPWYQKSAACFVYLSDLVYKPLGMVDQIQEQRRPCRWFTRGWTLQELIAPANVHFYDQNWRFIGLKSQLCHVLSSITAIDELVLKGVMPCEDVLIGRRMSWASGRSTTRDEDIAYCLLGIFDVNMPLLYGEGGKAFLRLQEEIIEMSLDLSIFAWISSDSPQHSSQYYGGLLAPSPAPFAVCHDLIASNSHFTPYATEYVIVQNRLRVERLLRTSDTGEPPDLFYLMPLGCKSSSSQMERVVSLRQYGSSLFARFKPYSSVHSEVNPTQSHRASMNRPQYILLRTHPDLRWQVAISRIQAIYIRLINDIPLVSSLKLRALGEGDIFPWPRWDKHNRVLLSSGEDEFWGFCTIQLKAEVENLNEPSVGRGLAIIVVGKRPKDTGFFYAVVAADNVQDWVWRDSSLLELATASEVWTILGEDSEVFSEDDPPSLHTIRLASSPDPYEIVVHMENYIFGSEYGLLGKVLNVELRNTLIEEPLSTTTD